jgi:hypothetical protein
MCEPTLILAGISIAAAAVQSQQANKAANKQAQALGVQAQNQQNALDLQQQQTAAQAADRQNEAVKQARAEGATFDAIAGEYGGGVTADRGHAATAFEQNQNLAAIDRDRNAALSQIGQESKGVESSYQSNLASIQRPSYIGTALTIAGAAAGGYAGYEKSQQQKAWYTKRPTTSND